MVYLCIPAVRTMPDTQLVAPQLQQTPSSEDRPKQARWLAMLPRSLLGMGASATRVSQGDGLQTSEVSYDYLWEKGI